MVTLPVPLLVMLAPAKALTPSVPWATLTVVLRFVLSMSATLTPLMLSGVSSAVVCAAGTVLLGASFTAVTLR